jgi:hypothetical protein
MPELRVPIPSTNTERIHGVNRMTRARFLTEPEDLFGDLSAESLARLMPYLADRLLQAPLVDVGEWHAMDVSGKPELVSRELQDVTLTMPVPFGVPLWQVACEPNLPWAEDHFQERIGGQPLNPPPSSEHWPYATGSNAGNDRHKKDGKFSHTYPERFWPKQAGEIDADCITQPDGECLAKHCRLHDEGLFGIRFTYGDFEDLVRTLRTNPFTRQAYLPIWFPEDTWAASNGERVPCTLGYHFLLRPSQHPKEQEVYRLNCTYYLRSCDFIRYFQDDIYMAGRLMFPLVIELGYAMASMKDHPVRVLPGTLTTHISSLHAFVGDEAYLKGMTERG